MKATKRQLIARCKQLGVMLTDDGDCLRLDAPVGKTFNDKHCRDLYLTGWLRPDAYAELIDELQCGLDECSDDDCDCCVHEPASFEEIHELYGGERLA